MKLSSTTISAIDKSGMLERVLNMPDYLGDALDRARKSGPALTPKPCNGIVVAGMGGSAISGDVIRGLTRASLAVPLEVSRSYELPGWVNRQSLVVISSYSGNTEETIAMMAQAMERQARILCVTAGGKIGEIAKRHGLPVYSLPTGFPPRSALPYLTVPVLEALFRLGLGEDPAADIAETAGVLHGLSSTWGVGADDDENLAKQIARALVSRTPIIYAASGLFEVAAWRWKEQFCENAEILAWHNCFPELNHNELVGWGLRPELDRNLQTIYLRDTRDHPRIQKRMEISRELIEARSSPVIEVRSHGESQLARLFSLIFLGDLVSVYLAVLNGVDPTPVKKIDLLKDRLSKISD